MVNILRNALQCKKDTCDSFLWLFRVAGLLSDVSGLLRPILIGGPDDVAGADRGVAPTKGTCFYSPQCGFPACVGMSAGSLLFLSIKAHGTIMLPGR